MIYPPHPIEEETDKLMRCPDTIYLQAQTLIDECSELSHLKNVPIFYYFKKKASKPSKRKLVLGKTGRFSERDAMLHGYEFWVELNEEMWVAMPDIRTPLLHHELSHIEPSEDGEKLELVDHDLTEFRATYKRFGAYLPDHTQFRKAIAAYESRNLEQEEEVIEAA